ncbi:plasmid-partitioning protein SopA [Klebsiella pneumoniae]|nr:plasmid-partitioning protein SopA [Klebsiella pneumoniae]
MSLINLLHECISRGQEMTQAIAIAQFGDDSPEARRITRRWGITEVADLIGVFAASN